MFPLLSLPAVVASRCCRFPLLSLPAVVASRCSSLAKALGLLFVFALFLLPLPSWAGNWVITFSGSSSMPISPAGATGWNAVGNYTFVNSLVTGPAPWHDQIHPALTISGGGSAGQCSINCNNVGTTTLSVAATLTWTPSFPGDTSQPPSKVDVLENASATDWTGGLPGSTGSASDGLGDSATFPGNVGANSTGSHLVQQIVSTGQLVVTLSSRTVTASFPAVPQAGNTAIPGTSCTYAVQIDNRDVAIQSSLGPTFYKNPSTGLPKQNERATSGFMAADTVSPDPKALQHVGYTPLYTPSSWGTGSEYQWTFASGLDSDDPQNGTFNTILYDVSSPDLFYTSTTPGPGSSEYVTLKLTDSKDGASATNNYSILFHAPYENWKDGPVSRHPVGLVKGGMNDTHPDWTYLMTISNGSSQNLVQNLTSAVSLAATESGTIGGQQTATPSAVAAFQLNESITVGKTDTVTYTTQTTFTGGPHTITQFFAAMTYENRTGTTDCYLVNGFQNNSTWQGVWTNGQVSPGSLEWPN